MPEGNSTNVELLSRLCSKKGTESDWHRFYGNYKHMIENWCRQFGVNPSDLEDLYQDIVIRLIDGLANFDRRPDARFRGWLKTVVTNTVIDRLRAASNSDMALLLRDLDNLQVRQSPEIEQLADQLTPSSTSAAVILARASDRVSESTWDAFIRRDLLDEDVAEIAASLGIKKASVYQSVSRVRKIIKEESQRWFAEDET